MTSKEISQQKARSLTNEGGWDAIQSGKRIVCWDGDVRLVIWATNYDKPNMKTMYYIQPKPH
jgi:hypothetical protein